MKIICIGRNYAEHAAELGNERPTQPVIFLKPDTALLRPNLPFYHPDFSKEIHYECEVVIRVSKEGKHIAPAFAHKYFEQIGLGIDFTARDLQNSLKTKGLPWELAKAFDNSAVCSPFFAKEEFPPLENVNFQLQVNGHLRQVGNTGEMLFSIPEIIAFVSQFFTLKIGDLIYTGTPKGVGKIEIGDVLEGSLEGKKVFSVEIK